MKNFKVNIKELEFQWLSIQSDELQIKFLQRKWDQEVILSLQALYIIDHSLNSKDYINPEL